MAFNGNGVFVRLYNWTNDANASIDIKSDRMDGEDNGFAGGLTNCICKDGQTTITANLPMSTFKHTGVGNAAARDQYAAAGQVQDGKFVFLGTSTGTDTITATATPTLPAYVTGQVFRWVAGGTNSTTTPTLNIDGLGAKTIQKLGGALVASDMTAGNAIEGMYDGTFVQLLSPTPVPVAGAAAAGTLTGTTLASNVVTSSITTLGTSASLPGSPTTTTQSGGDNSTKIATTAFVTAAVAAIPAFPTTAGAVHTYVLANKTSSSSITQFGDTLAGSTIEPANVQGTAGTTTSLSGTWQCMGFATNASASAASTTFYLRTV